VMHSTTPLPSSPLRRGAGLLGMIFHSCGLRCARERFGPLGKSRGGRLQPAQSPGYETRRARPVVASMHYITGGPDIGA
jgi:hypothetical protein